MQAAAFLRQPFLLPGRDAGPVKLVQLPPQAVDPAFPAVIHLHEFCVSPVVGDESGIGFLRFLHASAVFRVAHHVQIAQVLFLVRQELMLALPVQVQKRHGRLLQHRQRHHHAVDPADVSPARRQFPVKSHALSVKFDAFPVQDVPQAFRAPGGKFRLHRSPLTSRPDQVPVRPSAQDQGHCVHDNTLSGAGFAGKHGHPVVQFNPDVFNQRNVMNR